jgi:hypothetical protein
VNIAFAINNATIFINTDVYSVTIDEADALPGIEVLTVSVTDLSMVTFTIENGKSILCSFATSTA